MPFDQAQWQIDLIAADRTASAFNSLNNRMKQTQQVSQQTSSTMAAGFSAAAGMAARLSPVLLAVAAAHKVWEAGMKAADLGEQAEQIGLTTDLLQAYRLVAAQSGVAAEQLDASMMKLAKAMGTANDGNDEMIAKFERLGVKLLDSEGKLRKVSAVTPELARGLLAMSSETERNALMMELFGRSGSRMVTMLQDLAKGNDALVESAKKQNAIIAPETIKAWDDLADKLKVGAQRYDTLVATLGKPVAIGGLIFLNSQLAMTAGLLEKIGQVGKWVGETTTEALEGGSSEDLIKRQETIKATMEALKDSTDELDVAKLAGYRHELTRISDVLASRAKVYQMPADVITADKPGVSQPLGKKSGADTAAQANKLLADSQRKLDELVQDSSRQFEQAQQILIQYGDGALYAATEAQKLADLMPFLEKDPAVLMRAQKGIADRAAEMDRSFRGAQGGAVGFFAGMEQGLASMDKANSAFELGQAMVNNLSNSFVQAAVTGEFSFQQIAASFAQMLAQMAAQAAAHAALKMILGALGGSSGGSGMFDGLFSAIFGSPFGYAEGGRPPVGVASIVGERGPELFIPDSAGTVIPNHAFRRGGRGSSSEAGGGDVINIHMGGFTFGEFVSQTQLRQAMNMTRKAAEEGAQTAFIARRRSGEKAVKGTFG